MKVLLIDDEEDVRDIARLSLGLVGGMEVCDASSGREAVAQAIRERPDFILLDMMMPEWTAPPRSLPCAPTKKPRRSRSSF